MVVAGTAVLSAVVAATAAAAASLAAVALLFCQFSPLLELTEAAVLAAVVPKRSQRPQPRLTVAAVLAAAVVPKRTKFLCVAQRP